mmetsp:Transcript_5298/g.14990  ORF Transcript_5298/g.14990 Transcript_5298/m.14990 type:complete len:245 (-) Transcript_5298:193-927(-)
MLASSVPGSSAAATTALSPQKQVAPKPRLQLQRPSLQDHAAACSSAGTPCAVAATPTSRPLCTPTSAVSTQWRTMVCPHAPVKRVSRQPFPASADSTPGSDGLRTPVNVWPAYAGTPMAFCAQASPMGRTWVRSFNQDPSSLTPEKVLISPTAATGAGVGAAGLASPSKRILQTTSADNTPSGAMVRGCPDLSMFRRQPQELVQANGPQTPNPIKKLGTTSELQVSSPRALPLAPARIQRMATM